MMKILMLLNLWMIRTIQTKNLPISVVNSILFAFTFSMQARYNVSIENRLNKYFTVSPFFIVTFFEYISKLNLYHVRYVVEALAALLSDRTIYVGS